MSIRLRLMIIFSIMVAIIISVFSVYVYYSTVYIRKNAFFDRLWERTEIAYQLLQENPDANLSEIHPSSRKKFWTILPDEEIVVFDRSGHLSYINEFPNLNIDYSHVLVELIKHGKYEAKIGQRQIVGLSRSIDHSVYYIIVSAFDKNGQRLLNNLRLNLITSFLASVIILLIAGWYFSRESFKPVEKIIEAAENISESDLYLRVPIPKGKNELVRLVNTINDSLDRLQKSFEVQKTFVANASHELRTPLTALCGELEVALLQERSSMEYKQFLHMAYDDARRLSTLVNQLLLFAKTSSDRRAFNFEHLRIDDLVMDVMQKSLSAWPGRHIELKLTGNLSDEIHLMVNGDENLLLVAMMNIIDNALKYSENSDVVIEIITADQLMITVKDEGIGISLKDMESVFDPFYRSKCVSGVVGFGIGLPLARQIILLHSGELVLESKINEGTKVTIMLPIAV